MFRYKVEDVMEEKNLTKIIEQFKAGEIPRFQRLEQYYRVNNKILGRRAKDGKPNNKLAHGFAKYITKMATGYFMGKGVRYIVEGSGEDNLQEYKERLTEILDYNYTDNINFEVAKETSKKGIGFELLYIDENARLRSQKMNAEEIIPIYSPNIGEFLEAAVRIWTMKSIDGASATEYAALYTDREILTYARKSGEPNYRLEDIQYHMLEDIPVIVYWNNEEQSGDYEDVITLIDAYDKAQSDTANDSEYFADAYLIIVGAGGGVISGEDDEDNPNGAYRTMRREKVLHMDEKGQAYWMTKDINDTAQENYKNRLYQDIFFNSQVPPLSDESFAGNLTGVAIRYKLVALEELTVEKQNKFMAAQKKKIRLVTGFINTKDNKDYNPDLVEIKTERNFIDNISEAIEQAKNLTGLTSQETQLGQLPFIKDIGDEIVRINNEKGSSSLYGSGVTDNTPFIQKITKGGV